MWNGAEAHNLAKMKYLMSRFVDFLSFLSTITGPGSSLLSSSLYNPFTHYQCFPWYHGNEELFHFKYEGFPFLCMDTVFIFLAMSSTQTPICNQRLECELKWPVVLSKILAIYVKVDCGKCFNSYIVTVFISNINTRK